MQPTISTKAVINKIYRDLKPTDSSWEVDALEWFGEAIEYIGHHSGFVPKQTKLRVESFRAVLPCDYYIVRPKGVKLDGIPLPYGPQRQGYEPQDAAVYLSAKKAVLASDNFEVTRYGSRLAGKQATDEYYQLQGQNYLIASFEQGELELYYYAFPMDDQGYPTIPNNAYYKEALFWYAFKMMILGGYQHPVFSYDYADRKWLHFCNAAANDISYPTPDKFEAFMKGWVRMVPNYFDKHANDID